jgi:gluconolactonase
MMRWCLIAALTASDGVMGGETVGVIDRADPRFDELVPKDAKIEKLAGGFKWAEGPVWLHEKGLLVFSDVPNNVVHGYKPGETKVTDFLRPSGYTGPKKRGGEPGSNGLTVDKEGRLLLCEHGDRRVARLEKDGKKTTLADKFEGKRFNSPNDLAVHSNGDIYFTDPPYGLEKGMTDPAKEIPFQGVYRIAKSGEVTLLSKAISRPNGIAFSPNRKTLYVANSDPLKPVIYSFEVKEDGAVGEESVFFDTTKWMLKGHKGMPDGMKVDVGGNLFATGPGGVFVISAKGEYLGRIDPQVPTANCGFGDDGMLYLTANNWLCKIKTTTFDAEKFGRTFKVD